MARETKVGLLAGLAFIVCFAVILANRGGENAARGTTVSTQASDVPGNLQRSLGRAPSHANNNIKPRTAPGPRSTVAPQGRPNAGAAGQSATADTPVASSGADVLFNAEQGTSTLTLPWNNENREHPAAGASPPDRNERRPRPTMPAAAAVPPNSLVSDSPAKSFEQALDSVPKPEPSNIAQVSGLQPAVGSDRAAIVSRSGTSYIVAPGDNLSKIALHQYGTKSRSNVAAIFDANRDVLTSPNAVRSGMKLLLPGLPGVEKPADPSKKDSIASTSMKRSEDKPPGKSASASQPSTKSVDSAKPGSKKTTNSTKSDSKNTAIAKNSKDKNPPAKKPGMSPKQTMNMAATQPAAPPAATTITTVAEGDAPNAEKSAPPAKKDAPAESVRIYQVKKNDRYVSIARDQLGDGSRWRELHELNKDKFPDPQQIREGVRIKLPAASLVATAEDKH